MSSNVWRTKRWRGLHDDLEILPGENDNGETRFPLWDEMEQCFAGPEIQQRVRDRQEESAIELSNQSKERALVGEVIRSPTGRKKIAQRFIAGFPGDGGTSPARDERT